MGGRGREEEGSGREEEEGEGERKSGWDGGGKDSRRETLIFKRYTHTRPGYMHTIR